MPYYRVYAVRFDGNFDGYESLSCADDDEAVGRAKRLSRPRQLVRSVILPLPAQASHFIG